MEKYDYRKSITKEIKEWIIQNVIINQYDPENPTKLLDWLYDELWNKDCITGNGGYGYASEDKCCEYVGTNLGLYFEAAEELEDLIDTTWTTYKPASHMDTTIRCYLLMECIELAIKELNI